MASKPTGRAPGRPKKVFLPSKPKRRGRPQLPFLKDPDRYRIALLDAMTVIQGNNQRQAAQLLAALEVGIEIDPPAAFKVEAAQKGMVAVGWLRSTTVTGARASSIETRLRSLCNKSRQHWNGDPAVWRWRVSMAQAFLLAFVDNGSPNRATLAKMAALQVGELAFAQSVLVPIINDSAPSFQPI